MARRNLRGIEQDLPSERRKVVYADHISSGAQGNLPRG